MDKEESKIKENLQEEKTGVERNSDETSEIPVNEKEKSEENSSDEKLKDLEDKLKRAYAEMENMRRRFEKEKEEAFDYGGFSFARESLNLIDNLDRSKQSLTDDENLKNSDALKKIISHLDIIQADMISILKKNNIEQIKSVNEKLDPNLHQAMMEIVDNTKEPGTIIQEIQKGYTMKDRLLRPSLVGVAKKEENKDKKGQKEGILQENTPKK